MSAGLVDPRSQADIHAAVLALTGADREVVNAVRRATREVNQAAARLVRADTAIAPAAYQRVYAGMKIRPLYTRVTAREVTAGGIAASFIRGGAQLARQYEYGASSGDLARGRTRPKRSQAAAGRRYDRSRKMYSRSPVVWAGGATTARPDRRTEARIGMTQFPTRSRFGWYVGASAYRHLDEILTPWVDAVAGVFDG